MPPGLTTPPSQFWRKFGSLRGPGPALGSVALRRAWSNAGLSHHVYPSGAVPPVVLVAGGKAETAGAPSDQLLFDVYFGPRDQMLQVTEPAASRGVAVGLG